MDITLFEFDSPEDLVCRGFDREEIKALTGVDVGYHGSALRTRLKGVDRTGYKLAHVMARVSDPHVVLSSYAAGGSKADTLAQLGLRGENIVKLKTLFGDLGLSAEYESADKARRKAQMREGMTAKYGTDNAFKLEQFQKAAGDTRQQRYGGRYTLSADSVLAEQARRKFAISMEDPEYFEEVMTRRRETRRHTHPPLQGPVRPPRQRVRWWEDPVEVRRRQDKARQTMIDRYGTEHYSQTDAHRSRVREFMGEHGKELAAKARQTNLSRYGVVSAMQLPDQREATSVRMSDPAYQAQISAAWQRNGTSVTSGPEEELHGLLVGIFGDEDVIRQYRDDRYPWSVDFYIRSRDLFIELNGTWTHGGRWYEGSAADQRQIDRWTGKNTAYFDNALYNWTVRDVAKRDTAAASKLNYVVFWDGGAAISDARLWSGMGCPDGRDWDRMYSWLPDRLVGTDEFTFPDVAVSELSKKMTLQRAVKAANAVAFYDRELAYWNNNSGSESQWGTRQGYLYANRFRYLSKLPNELSDREILRGLGISGQVRAYSTFDTSAMKQVLTTYGTRDVFDPCAGWGERLLTCAAVEVGYLGVDINPAVVAGHDRARACYGLTAQRSVVGDAACFDVRDQGHDTVFTCPPYGDTEVYTQQGAENLGDEDFLVWWAQVVTMSAGQDTRVFAYQINQRWKDRMNDVVSAHGWSLAESIPLSDKSSHFDRAGGGGSRRREFEEVQVFVR